TTFIPYREYSRLLGIDSIDEYIRYGGTLRMGETDFDDEELKEEGIAFRDDESTRRYIYTAICRSEEHTSELQSRFDLVCRLLFNLLFVLMLCFLYSTLFRSHHFHPVSGIQPVAGN